MPQCFRLWWSRLKGGDESPDRNLLMRMAGHFSRRLRAYAAAHGIPVVNCAAGQEKHKLAEEYLEKASLRPGVFLILVGRAQAPVWDVSPHGHLEWKHPMPFVNLCLATIQNAPEAVHTTRKFPGTRSS